MPITAGLHYFLHEGGGLSRPPLVLIHGAGGNHLSWPPELRRLPDVRVFTLDLPGHGKTEGPGRQSIEDYASSIVRFLDEAGIARAVFAGHSMGGAIALSLALDFPERVCGLGLIATGSRLPVAPAILENAATAPTFLLAVKTLQQSFISPQTSPQLMDTIFKQLAANRQALLYSDLLACDRFDVTSRLDAIRTPALVVCGLEDKLTPVRYSEALATCIPGAALQTVDEAGHMIILEQPQRLAKLLNVFMIGIPYRPGG
jgi:pimeloyl-ACP methyl ester carboxylesterase